MHTLHRHTLFFACGLAALAGYIDAIGFIQMGGYFVSFMSGNSTRLAVGLQQGQWRTVQTVASLLGSFVAGAALGAIVRKLSVHRYRAAVILALVALLLLLALACERFGVSVLAMALLAMAMGSINAIIQSQGEQIVGVTYMTGTLVKLGQRIGDALLGGPRLAWMPYLLLWAGLVLGGITGACLFSEWRLQALWIAIGWVGCLGLWQWRLAARSRLSP